MATDIDANEAKRDYPSLALLLTVDTDDPFIFFQLVNGAIFTTSSGVIAVDGLPGRIVEPERVDAAIDA